MGDNLNCQITTQSTDADGDPVSYSYSWTKNGTSTGSTKATVPSSSTAKGDKWTCQVTASDSHGASSTASTTVTVARSWVLAWSHSLKSKPASAKTSNGAYRGQGPGTRSGRKCWLQESDWNNLYIPHSGRIDPGKPFAIEVDYYRSKPSPKVGHNVTPYTQIGGDLVRIFARGSKNSSTYREGVYLSDKIGANKQTRIGSNFTTGTWTSWRVEVYPGNLEIDLFEEGQFVGKARPQSPIQRGNYLSLGSGMPGGVGSSTNVCWSNLKVFEQP